MAEKEGWGLPSRLSSLSLSGAENKTTGRCTPGEKIIPVWRLFGREICTDDDHSEIMSPGNKVKPYVMGTVFGVYRNWIWELGTSNLILLFDGVVFGQIPHAHIQYQVLVFVLDSIVFETQIR